MLTNIDFCCVGMNELNQKQINFNLFKISPSENLLIPVPPF